MNCFGINISCRWLSRFEYSSYSITAFMMHGQWPLTRSPAGINCIMGHDEAFIWKHFLHYSSLWGKSTSDHSPGPLKPPTASWVMMRLWLGKAFYRTGPLWEKTTCDHSPSPLKAPTAPYVMVRLWHGIIFWITGPLWEETTSDHSPGSLKAPAVPYVMVRLWHGSISELLAFVMGIHWWWWFPSQRAHNTLMTSLLLALTDCWINNSVSSDFTGHETHVTSLLWVQCGPVACFTNDFLPTIKIWKKRLM